MGEEQPGRSPRLAWPDTYRGLVIILITAVHVAKALVPAGFAVEDIATTITDLQFVGMAAFFVISGMNSRKYLDGESSAFWGGRFYPLLYILLLWALLFPFVTRAAVGDLMGPGEGLKSLANALFHPSGYLWFVWSLLIYSTLVRVAARRSPRLVLLMAAVIAFAALGLDSEFWKRHPLPIFNEFSFLFRRALGYFLFFLAGYKFRNQIIDLGRGPLLLTLIPTLILGLSLPWVASKTPTNLIGAPLRIASLFLAIVASIYLGRLLARIPLIGTGLIWLGRLTLPVYLVHPLIVVIVGGIVARSADPVFRSHPLLTVTSITMLGILAGVIVAAAARPLRMMWLFQPPALPAHLRRQIPAFVRQIVEQRKNSSATANRADADLLQQPVPARGD